MKILSTKQLRDADQFTIENEPISSIELMERAASACAEWIGKQFSVNHSFSIFCGIGNNGGDGLAIARILSEKGISVQIFIVGEIVKATNDFQINYNRIDKDKIKIEHIKHPTEIPTFTENELIVDAIYGSGLNKQAEGLQKELIQKINEQTCEVISIDIPSGLFGENNSENDSEAIIQADFTLTFQQPKLSFLLADFGYKAGKWQILDIGLSVDFIEKAETKFQLLTQEIIQNKIRSREKFSHKGTHGHALIIAGSIGKM